MIAVDTNILVYAHRQDSEWYVAARAAVESLVVSGEPWAIPWHCLHEFISIVTNPGIYKPPSTPEEALNQIEIWMESPGLRLIGESRSYWPMLRETVLNGKLRGASVHDGRIHATCLANGVRQLWSADRGFSRMQGLAVKNPCLTP